MAKRERILTGIKEIDSHPDFDPRSPEILKWALNHVEDIEIHGDWIGYEDDHWRMEIEYRNNENVFLAFPKNVNLDEGQVDIWMPRVSFEKFHKKVRELLEWKLKEIKELHRDILGVKYD